MLDLSAYNIRKFKVNFKGKIYNLLPPMLKQVKTINDCMKVISLNIEGDELKKVAALIINRNDKGEKFDENVFENEPFDSAYRLVRAYNEWVNEIFTNPNLESPSVHK